MATAFPSVAISQASAKEVVRNILESKFGNGYSQRTPNGINYKRDYISVVWDGLNSTDKGTIVAFLEAVSNGSVISWQSPYDASSKNYILEGDWRLIDIGGNVYSISCKVKQVFEV